MTSCLATILEDGGAELRGTPLEASTTRILVVDDFEPWRRYVSTALQTNPKLEIIGEALDGLEAVLKTQQLQPDLILLDIGLPKLNGIEAGRRIRELSPKSKILFVSEERCPEIAEKALHTGAGGYVVKSAAAGDLLPAMEAVLNERRFVSASLLVMISPSLRRHDAIGVATEPDTTNPVCSDL
jgi:DNA-binding NarL/FixJ family response regulator